MPRSWAKSQIKRMIWRDVLGSRDARHVVHRLRLDREHHDPGGERGIDRVGTDEHGDAVTRMRGLGERHRRLDHRDRGRRNPAGDPALEQRAPHLAAADEEERAGDRAHASPTVSRIAAARASAGACPPQITYWNAG